MQNSAQFARFGTRRAGGVPARSRGGRGLPEKLRDQTHRHEQPTRLGLQGEKSVMPIEGRGGIVLGVDHHCHRCNLIGMGEAAAQGIQKQMLPEALALRGLIHGEPAQQSDGELRIARQLVGQFVRQVDQGQHRSRQGVVAADARVRLVDGDERRGHALIRVLPGLMLQVAVERFRAAVKDSSVVLSAQRLDSDAGYCHRL